MIRKPETYRRYNPVRRRFLKPAIEDFFIREFPRFFGPGIVSRIAEELVNIVEKYNPDAKTLKPGQLLWTTVSKDTRADSHNCKKVQVILTIIKPEDIDDLEINGLKTQYTQKVIARIMKEAYDQGGLLSSRDISLILAHSSSSVSKLRIAYEKDNCVTLPHTGNLHDMGSCITHKNQIIYKYVVQKKDPIVISKETNHTLIAVDHYIKDYNRVKMLYLDNKSTEYIKMATSISTHVIKQYINIINNDGKEQKVS